MMRTLRFGMMLVMAASAYGCDEKKDAAPATPVAAPAAPAPAAPAPAAPVAAAPGTPAPAGDVKPGDAPKMGDVGKALGDAMNAAAQAKGATPCETAFLGMEAMMKGLEKNMGAGGKKAELPPKDKFVGACKELPEPVQQCLTMEYGMAHQKECQEARAKLDPAKLAKLKELMGGKG